MWRRLIYFTHAGQRAFNETERSVGDGTTFCDVFLDVRETSLNGWITWAADSVVVISVFAPAQEWERYWSC